MTNLWYQLIPVSGTPEFVFASGQDRSSQEHLFLLVRSGLVCKLIMLLCYVTLRLGVLIYLFFLLLSCRLPLPSEFKVLSLVAKVNERVNECYHMSSGSGPGEVPVMRCRRGTSWVCV